MEENKITVEQIKEEIKKLKFEIIEKENKINELLEMIDSEEDSEDEF